MRKAEKPQQAADRFQAETNVEMRQHLVADVRQAPAAYAVGFEVRAAVDPRHHRRPLRRRPQRAANLAARPAIQNQRNRPQATRLRGALALAGQVVQFCRCAVGAGDGNGCGHAKPPMLLFFKYST